MKILKKGKLKVKKTDRGFSCYDKFKDSNDSTICISESSIAGDPHCRIYTTMSDLEFSGSFHDRIGKAAKGFASDLEINFVVKTTSPHLTVDQAKRLIAALQEFINHSEDPHHWKNHSEYINQWRRKL